MTETKDLTYISKQKLLSIALPCLLGWTFSYLATNVFRDYGFGLFIWLPLVLGATSTLILAYKSSVPRQKLRNNAYLTLLIFCIGLLAFAWEGIICLIMATPIGFVFTYFGFLIGFHFSKSNLKGQTPTAIILLVLSAPSLMAFEDTLNETDNLRSVVTTIEINATPEKVWKNVVSFPQLKEPTEFIFKTGIAYPINATIKGQGVGAVRHCNFSTGSFVEPITVWDEPRLLKFSVDEQPEPMKEISIYDIHPNHLHGYWVSKQGQFKLTALPNGHTLLEGTTWYVNKIKPAFYWTLWSDNIVHKIHKRVLEHIKTQAEL
ncbi:SRPBCC family protein [Lacibacter sp. H407]|uniref:SRPBCC family protein n=1 Tax=Lacibacter sp. H407 TaxID=3133423 RepID=UPI0030C1A6B2